MARSHSSAARIAVVALALGGALLLTGSLGAAEAPILFYFDDSTLSVQPRTINGATYIPLREIISKMALPYSEVFATETYTIRGPGGQQAVLTRDARSISVDGRVTQLSSPILRESGEWLAPIDFLDRGLNRIAGVELRHRADAHRVFVGRSKPPDLSIAAQEQGAATRITLHADAPFRIEMRRERNRVVFTLDRIVDPVRERLDLRGRLVAGIAFDDSDGKGKILVDTNDVTPDVRISATEENRTYLIDLSRPTEITALPAPGPSPLPTLPQISPPPILGPGFGPAREPIQARPPAAPPKRRLINVIVLDPGHGGIDAGTVNGEVLEKNLTLAMARRMRPVLENRLGSTVLLTRDSDVDLTSEARSVLANNNQAGLFISLHVGQSTNKQDFGAIYVMKDDFAISLGDAAAAAANDKRLFVPWYLGYRSSLTASKSVARLLRDELEQAIPAWRFPVRQGPLAVLASSVAPSIVLEIGNLNDPVTAQALLDPAFQNKVVTAAAMAIERYAALREAGAY